MQAYSQDLRERVVRACDAGLHTRARLAELFHVSTAWIRRLLQRRRETGAFAARPHGGGAPRKLDDAHRDRLAALVAATPDATLAELHQQLGAPVHRSTIDRALTRLRLTVKKKSSTPPSSSAPTCKRGGSSGGRRPPASTRRGSSSSMRRGRTPP